MAMRANKHTSLNQILMVLTLSLFLPPSSFNVQGYPGALVSFWALCRKMPACWNFDDRGLRCTPYIQHILASAQVVLDVTVLFLEVCAAMETLSDRVQTEQWSWQGVSKKSEWFIMNCMNTDIVHMHLCTQTKWTCTSTYTPWYCSGKLSMFARSQLSI